ncbi:hypothetical protein ATANTOWER_021417 [Ataeniobius toweri]|uniref:Uncharacterized protein n=1 Tax=Ataeniobius toweri TaxID=208326 RepID=A0ABU7BTT4_9TELE|nr:hypothetical protein [Ataeniobius toweri]
MSYNHRSYAKLSLQKQTVPEKFPTEKRSLRSRAERSPSLEGRQQRPHHRGYGNVQCGWRTERAVFHPQLRRLAVANRLKTVDVSSNFSALDNVPHHSS